MTAITDQAASAAIAALRPDLADAPLQRIGEGFDSVAFSVSGTIVKFPRHPEAARRLAVEAAILAVARPRVRMALPDLAFHPGPPPLSVHPMIPGDRLTPDLYPSVPVADRDRLARTLAHAMADLHRVPVPAIVAAGGGAVEAWSPPSDLRATAATLPAPRAALDLVDRYAALGPDPLGEVFGQFDGHGWNMAFDRRAMTLNGLYDFGDAGIGPLHRDFVYVSFVGFDLQRRVMAAYVEASGLALDARRIAILTAIHRLWEIETAPAPDRDTFIAAFAAALAEVPSD